MHKFLFYPAFVHSIITMLGTSKYTFEEYTRANIILYVFKSNILLHEYNPVLLLENK